MPLSSSDSVLCEHANENPASCHCPSDCYCQTWTCKSRIRFKCPDCGARHDRGYLNGVDIFRCLHCGYTGPEGLEPPKSEVSTAWDRLLEQE